MQGSVHCHCPQAPSASQLQMEVKKNTARPQISAESPARTRNNRELGLPCSRTTRKRQRTNEIAPVTKRVRFHASAKTHDGIAGPQAAFQRLICGFFNKNRELNILLRLLEQRNHEMLHALFVNTKDTILRLKQSSQGKVPLLRKGGGRGLVAKSKNLPHLYRLLKIVALTYQRCKRLIGAQTAQQS